jgi:hypothetical protein
MKITVTSLVCSACSAELKGASSRTDALAQLSMRGGKCPQCGQDRFRATITRTMSGYEPPTTEDYLLQVALPTSNGLSGHTVTWDTVFELPELKAADLFAHLSQPPEAISEWITGIRKEEAKSHLRPDQRLCAGCGEIYTVELAGFTREGFCSPLCRKRVLGASNPLPSLTEPQGKAVACPKCGQPVRPRPGAKCMHCSAPLSS